MAVAEPTPITNAITWSLTGGIVGVTNTNPFLSLGGQRAATIISGQMDNLFDPVSSTEQSAGKTEYRWITCRNISTEIIREPHFYFLPKDDNIDIEFSKLSVSAPVSILPTEEDRPIEEEIGPEIDVPMPFTKSTESYETTLSIGPNIPANGGTLYICVRRVIPEDSVSEPRAARLICESRIPLQTSASLEGAREIEPGDISVVRSAAGR